MAALLPSPPETTLSYARPLPLAHAAHCSSSSCHGKREHLMHSHAMHAINEGRTPDGVTPLMLAAKLDNIEVVRCAPLGAPKAHSDDTTAASPATLWEATMAVAAASKHPT